MEKIIFTGMRLLDIFTKYNGICGRITKKQTSNNSIEITVGDEAITLEEGEVVEIPMILIENDESGIQPFQAVKPLSAMLEIACVWEAVIT